MKKCPKCGKTFDASWEVCLGCRIPLVEDTDSRLARLEEQAKRILKEIDDIRKGKPSSQIAEKQFEKPEPKTVKKEDTEVQIGKYILNKVGIVSI